MMSVDAVQYLDMQVHTCTVGNGIEKLPDQLSIQPADHRNIKFVIKIEIGTSAQIHCARNQRVIHRQQKISVTFNSFFVSDCLSDRLPEYDSRIFYGMMSVHKQISVHFYRQIKKSVPCKAVQHMVEKSDAGINIRAAGAV